MTISAILIVNQKGETVVSRFYRDDVKWVAPCSDHRSDVTRPSLLANSCSRKVADAFKAQVIGDSDKTLPVVNVLENNYCYIRCNDVYLVAVTKKNANAGMLTL